MNELDDKGYWHTYLLEPRYLLCQNISQAFLLLLRMLVINLFFGEIKAGPFIYTAIVVQGGSIRGLWPTHTHTSTCTVSGSIHCVLLSIVISIMFYMHTITNNYICLFVYTCSWFSFDISWLWNSNYDISYQGSGFI